MLLYFMRHGEAEEASAGQGDFGRRLTPRGEKRTQATARVLRKLGVQLSLILTSPLTRARQTAALVGAELAVPVGEEPALACGCNLERLAEALEQHPQTDAVMVVGHEPDFSLMIGELIGHGQVEMRKGAVACVAVQGLARGGGVLLWLMAGKDLAALD